MMQLHPAEDYVVSGHVANGKSVPPPPSSKKCAPLQAAPPVSLTTTATEQNTARAVVRVLNKATGYLGLDLFINQPDFTITKGPRYVQRTVLAAEQRLAAARALVTYWGVKERLEEMVLEEMPRGTTQAICYRHVAQAQQQAVAAAAATAAAEATEKLRHHQAAMRASLVQARLKHVQSIAVIMAEVSPPPSFPPGLLLAPEHPSLAPEQGLRGKCHVFSGIEGSFPNHLYDRLISALQMLQQVEMQARVEAELAASKHRHAMRVAEEACTLALVRTVAGVLNNLVRRVEFENYKQPEPAFEEAEAEAEARQIRPPALPPVAIVRNNVLS